MTPNLLHICLFREWESQSGFARPAIEQWLLESIHWSIEAWGPSSPGLESNAVNTCCAAVPSAQYGMHTSSSDWQVYVGQVQISKQENKAVRDVEQCMKVSSSDGGWLACSVDPHSSSASNTLSLFDSCECSSGCLVNCCSLKSHKQWIIPFLGCMIELHYMYASKGSTWWCAYVDHSIFNCLSFGTIVWYRCVAELCFELNVCFPFMVATTNVLVSGATRRTPGSSLIERSSLSPIHWQEHIEMSILQSQSVSSSRHLFSHQVLYLLCTLALCSPHPSL